MWWTPHAVHSVDKCAICKMWWIIQCVQVCRVLCINKLVIHTTQTTQCVLTQRMSYPTHIRTTYASEQATKSEQCLVDTGALRSINHLTEHKPRVETSEDPLFNPKPEKETIEFNPEQAHNILTPYYRTIDEPWDQQAANDPRITLAAMFKANSTKLREDSVKRQCSRPACQYRTDCYWERRWEQRQGRGMYNYTQCI